MGYAKKEWFRVYDALFLQAMFDSRLLRFPYSTSRFLSC